MSQIDGAIVLFQFTAKMRFIHVAHVGIGTETDLVCTASIWDSSLV